MKILPFDWLLVGFIHSKHSEAVWLLLAIIADDVVVDFADESDADDEDKSDVDVDEGVDEDDDDDEEEDMLLFELLYWFCSECFCVEEFTEFVGDDIMEENIDDLFEFDNNDEDDDESDDWSGDLRSSEAAVAAAAARLWSRLIAAVVFNKFDSGPYKCWLW